MFYCTVYIYVIYQEGKSLLEWTQERAESIPISDVKPSMKNEYKKESDMAKNSFRILSDFRPISVSIIFGCRHPMFKLFPYIHNSSFHMSSLMSFLWPD